MVIPMTKPGQTPTSFLRFPCLILLTLVLVTPGRSQSFKPFPDDTTGFASAFSTFMFLSHLNDEQKQEVTRFIGMVSSDSATVTAEKRTRILYTLNRLKSRRAKQTPYFLDYIGTVLYLTDKNTDDSYFDNWDKGLVSFLDNQNTQLRYIRKYLSGVLNFLKFYDLANNQAVTWSVKPTTYQFQFQNGFFIRVGKTTLTCYAQGDSIMIHETSGKYDPYNSIWYGESGKVTWERAGYPRDSVFARLPAYKIVLSRNGYHVDSVSFVNRVYFSKPILGTLDDKATHFSASSKATFPKFDSYIKHFKIKNLFPNVDYEGGFSMQGAVVKGTGNIYKPATLRFYRNDTLQVKVRSLFFAIMKDRVSGRKTNVSFFLDRDSIFHPNIAFVYDNNNREVSLYQTEDPMTQSPYYDTYHKLNIQANRFVWKAEKNRALFTRLRGTTIGTGKFWSTNFFNAKTYYRLQGMDAMNPLYLLKKFAEWYYSDEFPVEELAKWMKKPEYQVRRLLVHLAVEGFVFYNPETGEVKLKKELYDYLDAFGGKIDYDVMSFLSRTKAPVDNAVIDMHNFDMTINGVPTIFLSDSQDVAIYPADHRIIMHRNRCFSFDGEIQAGMAVLDGKNFFFDYDTFKIDLFQIDSVRLTAYGDSVEDLGNPVPEKIKNTLEVVTGYLYIDNPANKSGRKHYDTFPYFQSIDSSFVFYNKASVYDSIYTREDFHFIIRPFTLYSLNNLYKKDLIFKGDFVSGKIFPPIPQNLEVQPDNSLGFVSQMPEEGIPLYNGKGRFFNDVELSNQGLQGAGKLKYLTTTVFSDHFSFFPDSMVTGAHDLTVEATHEGTRYPDVKARDVSVKWLPKENTFHIHKKSTDISLFDTLFNLDGDIILTPDYLTAQGTILFPGSEVTSGNFLLTDTHVAADTSDFVLSGTNPGENDRMHAFRTRSDFDVPARTARFESLFDTLHIEFPDMQWITSLDAFTFDFGNERIYLRNNKTSDDAYLLGNNPAIISGKWVKMPTFISLYPPADTLGFYSDSATFDLTQGNIKTFHTAFVEVADALLYPDSMSVRIGPNGYLNELEDARLVAANTYTLDSARLKIYSRKSFEGSGLYKYTEENGETENIFFTDIRVDNSLHTHAETDLPPEIHFMLSPAFAYTGKVELSSNREHLWFTGGAKAVHPCREIPGHFLAFSSEIDPNNVLIPVEEQMLDIHKKKIYSGHFITNDSTHIYPAFLSSRKNYSDTPISSAQGVLSYDKKSGEYRIGSEEKVHDPSVSGNYLSLDRNNCRLYGEGMLNLGVRFGRLKIITPGTILQSPGDSNKINLHVMIGLDFYFDPEALNIMAGEIDSLTSLTPVDIRSDWYDRILGLLGPSSKTSKADIQEMKMFGQLPVVPKEQKHTLFLSDVTLEWNHETGSYVSVGKIGLGNIDGHPLNVAVNGYLEIQKKRSGDIFDLYLKLSKRNYYYFAYTPGVLQAISSNNNFMKILASLKESKRKLRSGGNQPPYIFMAGVERKKIMFLRKMQMIRENNPSE